MSLRLMIAGVVFLAFSATAYTGDDPTDPGEVARLLGGR